MKKQSELERSIQDPIVMKRIIDTMLDPKNPDSGKIKKEVVKNIALCIQKDDAFLTTIKGMVLENAEAITKDIVTKCINDSDEYLTNALVTTINMRCKEFFDEKKRIVNNVLKKTLDDCVHEILKTTKQTVDKNDKIIMNKTKKCGGCYDTTCLESKDTYDIIQVPNKYKQEVQNYIGFLKTRN